MWSRCDLCGGTSRGLCRPCRLALAPPPEIDLSPHLDSVIALCAYEGHGANLVRAAKFRNRRTCLPELAAALAPSVPAAIDAVVSVPGDVRRVRSRGYDLPRLLARELARRVGLPVRACLRIDERDSQRGRSRTDRLQRSGFEATTAPTPARVVLVDDVVTTGATARRGATALRAVGTSEVHLVVIAATPPDRRSEI